MRPLKTLFFTLAVFVLLAATMIVTPKDGVKIGEFNFHMPTFNEMFFSEKVEYANISEIIEHQIDIDSITELVSDEDIPEEEKIDTASYHELVASIHKIEMKEQGRTSLYRFFKKLKSEKTSRIMHYGDSQLEGDRITANFRNKVQVKFGGSGLGLRPVVQPYNFIFSAVQTNSDNWSRYPLYRNRDTMVLHNNYGVMGAFSRFAPLRFDSIPFEETEFYNAQLSISKSNISFRRNREYKKMSLFYGNSKSPVQMQLFVNDSMVFSDTLKANIDYGVSSCILPDSTDNVTFKFSGYDSPDFYGVELVDTIGVTVDNIALRGSSGTIFTQTNFEHSTKMYHDLNPGLFILQFGGNVMPYIKDQTQIDNYARWFGSQIKRLRRSCPDAAFIVIGPSDMSTKEKDKYITYELLPDVVDALKKSSIENGAGYWDMYQAMGGYNSMPSWVNAQPELARPDYVHFSSRGSKLISNMFYNAFILEYNNYLKQEKLREDIEQ